MAAPLLSCPFCGFQNADDYFLTLHIEELHIEDSPFVAKDNSKRGTDANIKSRLPEVSPEQPDADCDDLFEEYVACPLSECGEELLTSDLNEHLDYHFAERVTLDEQQESSLSTSSRELKMHSSSEYSSGSSTAHLNTSTSPSSYHTDHAQRSTPSSSSKDGSAQHRRKRVRKVSREVESGRLGVRDWL